MKSAKVTLTAQEIELLVEFLTGIISGDIPGGTEAETPAEVIALWKKHRAGYVKRQARMGVGREEALDAREYHDREAALLAKLGSVSPVIPGGGEAPVAMDAPSQHGVIELPVRVTPAQASRIENIAGMLKIEPGELMTCCTFSGLYGWRDQPSAVVEFIDGDYRDFVKNGQAGGEEVEGFIRAGLAMMSLTKLKNLIARSDSFHPAEDRVRELAEARKTASAKRKIA